MAKFAALYADGGHRARSKILAQELNRAGVETELRYYLEPIPYGDRIDGFIVDAPWEHVETTISRLPMDVFVVVMGTYSPYAHLNWHPLGPYPGAFPALRGIEYLILDPTLPNYYSGVKLYDLVISLGTQDPLNLLPDVLSKVKWPESWNVVVIDSVKDRNLDSDRVGRYYKRLNQGEFWSVLSRSRVGLLGWGQSCFEATILGLNHVAVPHSGEHIGEIKRLGIPYAHPDNIREGNVFLDALFLPQELPNIDLLGAIRTTSAIIEHYTEWKHRKSSPLLARMSPEWP